jgi:hypothetical protein
LTTSVKPNTNRVWKIKGIYAEPFYLCYRFHSIETKKKSSKEKRKKNILIWNGKQGLQ